MAYAIIATMERRKEDFERDKNLKPETQTRVKKFRKSLEKVKIKFKQIYIPPGITTLPESLTFQISVNSISMYRSETPLEVFIW